MAKLEDVFGVSSQQVLSYVEREQVDTRFKEALSSTKQIIVYGSSKQGKTALVSKHLPYDDNILVSLTPKTQLTDIYQTILSKAGVKVVTGIVEKKGTESTIGISAKFRALIPLFGSAETELKGNTNASSSDEIKYEEIPLNLELPQAVSDLLTKVNFNKIVILENFHYLNDDIQRQFAFDLRAFQELNVQFVILGVWREKNRMAQFNGDLLDRTIEIPVEPWHKTDFEQVVKKGEEELGIEIDTSIIQDAVNASFSSIGVFQELLKQVCLYAGVTETITGPRKRINDHSFLELAIETKTNDYSSRHQRALEAISAGHTTGGAKSDLPPLFLPYYLVRAVLLHGFDGISGGCHRNTMHEWIKAIHHRGGDVRVSDMTNLLGGLANLQSVKSISPPILAYDAQQRMLQVVDSTFYFFVKNADTKEIAESIQNPLDNYGST